MTRIPFKVSARTARLIGRENVATSKGAVIELVKNGYDADSRYSIIYIDNINSVFHELLSAEQYNGLLLAGIEQSLLEKVYIKKEDAYVVRESADSYIRTLVQRQKELAELYIIDCGEGMTRLIIENYWMTIGTDNKSSNYITHNGRVKAGAKGIGRFALDKLGENCEMLTFFDPYVHDSVDEDVTIKGYRWSVNWSDFEGTGTTIDSIGADLEGLTSTYLETASIKTIAGSSPPVST